ncbi:DNA-binding response regulator [Actinoalloteichus sp. AHMU CJ021]|uniref:Two component transcriptional regulator, LuxR family n=1 Tax=Actinoalloteichus caeruleus DSM 43889 TaxID=1120930 RepID=A0ABT1JM35_ACTCY|nr:response regulator transcription factor [Actinoalloteichus caeruleus]AUS79155.1 DNA-binding response regulator [Actinoalloteichus sp. AHMU CJ021]MCP2333407.1 two component transcriptional regulator, LuxR family [Actinoalloteichus caeruleus DSM 43889]
MIRVLLADDEALTRGAVAALLDLEDDLVVVGQAADGMSALAAVRRLRPDVALVDVEMPGLDGPRLALEVARSAPGTRCVVLTRHARAGVLRRALANGARGFVPKTSPAALLADVVRRVHAGGRYVDPDVAADALSVRENPLTDRERQVLAEVGDGVTARAIARVVHLSPGTVRNYLSSAMAKLGVGTRWQAAERARDHGWI